MKARHFCAILGIAIAVGAVVFVQSLIATNDHQSVAVAGQMLEALPVEAGARTATLQLDFRPDGRVLQGPPMIAMIATRSSEQGTVSGERLRNGVLVSRAVFAQRRVRKLPEVGEELTLVGRKGAYKVKIAGYLDWERPVRGYPNMFVSPETAAAIDEEWSDWEPKSAEDLAPMFRSDAGRNMDRSKPLLLWAAALTALALLLNSLFLSIESRRKEIATLRMVGLTRGGVMRLVLKESFALSFAGLVIGVAVALASLRLYVSADAATFPMGMAVGLRGILAAVLAAPFVAVFGSLIALRSALAVKPLEAASNRPPKPRRLGMLIAFACGFGAFVAVEVWGSSLTKPFIPSPEWPDAIVSILPGGVSSFDIEKLQSLPGVKRIAELQPLQVNLDPLEELKGMGSKDADTGKTKGRGEGEKAKDGGKGRAGGFGGRGRQYRNALLLASDWLPDFRLSRLHSALQTSTASLSEALQQGDTCVITEMMARAHGWKVGDELKLDCGRGLRMALRIVGIVDLNWHMVTSRGLVRGLNRMPVNTDGPVFVSFDTLAACDARPQEFVHMTHLWLSYEPEFLAEHGVFPAGRIVEREIVEALGGAYREDKDGEVHGNTVRLHARDEVSDGTLAHGTQLVGAMARVPFIFLAVISLGFIAMLVASADARRREFTVLHAVGATKWCLARRLIREATRIAAVGIVLGAAGGALAGWLFTAGTRAAMANWGLPASFDFPASVIVQGAFGALVFALVVAVPASLVIVSRSFRR